MKVTDLKSPANPFGRNDSTPYPHARWGMVIDQDRCIGCWTCAIACKSNNNVPLGMWWNRILTVSEDPSGLDITETGGMDEPLGDYPDLTISFLPVNCFHCDNPPCTEVCPVAATYQREDGIVMVDWDRCIGCRYCMIACPYNMRVFNWSVPDQVPANADPANLDAYHVGDWAKPPRPKGIVEKCDFCYQRVDEGLQPFCIEVCPARARVFGDLNDPQSEVSQLVRNTPVTQIRADLGTEPKVYYIPAKVSGGGARSEIAPMFVDPERRNISTGQEA
jgi:molybdopterin-containing oxidoreductase family iron-sulfur binding subunit